MALDATGALDVGLGLSLLAEIGAEHDGLLTSRPGNEAGGRRGENRQAD
jgi:hypothetical protein